MRARVLISAVLLTALAACGDDGGSTGGDGDDAGSSPAAGSCTYATDGQAAKKVELPPSDPESADELTIATNRGDIRVTLDPDRAPCTTGSFTSLAEQGYFDGTECHRLTTSGIYVLQCGDPTGTGSGGPGYRFGDELEGDETYTAGTVAMANAGPDTNGSQFFIVYQDSGLPPSYTVFGHIDDAGLAVVQKVAKAGSDEANGPGDGHPLQGVEITSVG